MRRSPKKPPSKHPSARMTKTTEKRRTFPMSEERFQRKVLQKLMDLEDQLKELRGLQNVEPFSLRRMDSVREFQEMEEQLDSRQGHKEKLIAYLARVGGKCLRGCITNMMDRLFTNSLMAVMNLRGTGIKMAFGPTALFFAVSEAAKRWDHKATNHNITQIVSYYLKHAPGRSGGGGYNRRSAANNVAYDTT